MKRLFSFTLLFFVITNAIAQGCNALDMIQEGSKWELTSYNKRDKVEASTYYHITSVESQGDAVVWTLEMDMKDKKGEIYSESTTEISCEEGIFKMSMQQFMNNEQFQGMQDMDVEIDASDLEYPTAPEVGQTLPDATMEVTAAMNGITMMNITTTVTDRKVESEEKIDTPAGTYDCLLVTQKTTVANKLISKEVNSKDWYYPGFGVVRSESYNKKGKMTGYTMLTMHKQ